MGSYILRKFSFAVPIFAGIVLILAGCSSVSGIKSKGSNIFEIRETASQLVKKDWQFFSNFFRDGFRKRVSDNFIPDKHIFLEETENSFYQEKPVDFSFFLNQVRKEKNKLAVSIHWEKKVVERSSGDLKLKQGDCFLVYIYENGQWLLYQVRGESIFAL
jgi:hypothetical protein